jgi:O-antigen ligase
MRALTVVLFGLVLACPLVAVPGTGFDSFRLPAVLVLAAALLGLAFVRTSRGGDHPPGPAPLRTAGFLLLGVHLLSLLAARSAADAAGPILILAAALAVFSCMRGGLLRKDRALALLPVIPITALLVSGIGAVQTLLKMEAVSTEGNRNYAGALAALLLPPTVAFIRRGKSWERLLSVIASAGLIFLLLCSESRGGFLGALAGLLAAAWALSCGKVSRGAATAAAAILIVVALFAGTQGKHQISQSRLETALFRIEVWKSGLRMLAKRPVLGWGAGGFSTEYPPFRSEAEFQISHSDGKDGFREVEDPHSIWVATAVETGIPGLLSLLLVVYVAARLWRYDVKHAADPQTAAALAGLGGGALAYAIAGGFNTLTVHASHTVLFWSFLGLMEAIGETRTWRPSSGGREGRVGIPAAAAMTLLFGAFWSLRLGLSDLAFVEGGRAPSAQATEALLREAIEDYPQSWRAHYELARTLSLIQRFPGAAEEARETLKLRPYHVEALNLAAISILRSGGDPAEAERQLRLAIDVAPYYFKSYFNLALLEGDRGHGGESRRLLSQAIEHKPDHGPSYYYRGLTFLGGGETGLRFDVSTALRGDRPSAVRDPGLSEFFK